MSETVTTDTPATPRPMRADARRNRERVIDAARIAFSEHGLLAQMDDIATAAGVGIGTVYRHFPTKEQLIAELVRQRFQAFAEFTRDALASDEAPFDAMATSLRRGAELCASDVGLQDVLARPPAETLALIADDLEDLRGVTTEMIRRAIDSGEVRPDLRFEDIPMLMSSLSTTMSPACPFVATEDWPRHLEFILDGMRAR